MKMTYLPDFAGESFALCIGGTVHYYVKIASLLLLRPILVCSKCSYICKVSKFLLFLLVLSHWILTCRHDAFFFFFFIESSVILSRESRRTLLMYWLQVVMIRAHPKIGLIVLLLLLGRRNGEEQVWQVIEWLPQSCCVVAFELLRDVPVHLQHLGYWSNFVHVREWYGKCRDNKGKRHCYKVTEPVILLLIWICMNEYMQCLPFKLW